MANKTDPNAVSVRGSNPQNIVEKIVREKIYNSVFWKQECFGLNAESLVDRGVELKAVGGTAGGNRLPSNFLCLVLKMLQIQPEKDIVIEFIKQEDYKYLRVLGAFYLRLTGNSQDVYQYLEPLYNDPRKIRRQGQQGGFVLSHVDELIEEMLISSFMFDIALPFVPNRLTMERMGQLQPWVSVLDEEFDETALIKDAGEHQRQREQLEAELIQDRDEGNKRRSRSRSRERRRDRDRDKNRDRVRDRDRSKDRLYERKVKNERRKDTDSDKRERSHSPKERRKKKDKKERKEKKEKRKSLDDDDIDQQNALRARLGLNPLRP